MKSRVPTVSKLIKRSRKSTDRYEALLQDGESMLSTNKVTGISLNFPIAETCSPTKVCINTCYFARGGSSWPAALSRQYRIFNSVKADPIGSAVRLQKELLSKKKPPTFLRWNGGGDLFAESVKMLNHLAKLMPEMPIWVVTRLPKFAAKVENASNVFIHFSIDAHSGDRRIEFERLKKLTSNYFFSYQCNRGEEPIAEDLKGVSVVFYDCYQPPAQFPKVDMQIICPLNTEKDISGVCEWCRRCFDGAAVKHSQNQAGNHTQKSTPNPRKTSQKKVSNKK
jgi:hypothetical protein